MARRINPGSSWLQWARPGSGRLYSIALTVIVVAAAKSAGLLNLNGIQNIATTVIGIGFIIFVHELGHFLVAKACGVKCEKFYLGFDVYGLKLAKFQWGETEYGIGAVPLGGYVKMLGQDDNVANAEAEAERTRMVNPDGTVTLDPRSYPAKSVPQRMAIISAGVIMNLIFAVIFAAVAFTLGAEYEPCVIGRLTGGSAAWKAGIEPGDRILQFGRSGEPSRYLRYQTDLLEHVFLHDPRKPLELLVEKPNGEQKWITTHPKNTFERKTIFGDKYRPRIGVGLSPSLELMAVRSDDSAPLPSKLEWTKAVRPGDRIVAANGKPVESYAEFSRIDIEHFDEPLTLTIERTKDEKGEPLASPERYEATVPPQRRMELGVYFQSAPISTVLEGSPAANAGVEVGDLIVKLNDEAIVDPTVLPQRFAKLGGVETKLTVLRGPEKKEVDIMVTPKRCQLDFIPTQGSEVTIDGLGIAFPVENVVASVSPKLSEQKVDIAPGDRVTAFALEPELGEKEKRRWKPRWEQLRSEQPDGDRVANFPREGWAALHLRLQRGDKTFEVRVASFESEDFELTRTLPLQPLREIRKAESASDALFLGVRETKESAFKVLGFLQNLVTGGISPTNLGGPLSIVYIANQQASLGITKFLLFLTLISANLAVVNFLPIPVLDGGHMMFLAAEAVRGKPVDESWQIRLTMLGFFFVLGLMLFVISLDVLRFSGIDV